MKSSLKAIYDVLSGDSELLSMLASNSPYYNSKGASSTKNSIVPLGMITRKMNTPLVAIGEGTETRIGNHLKDESFYVRCYNDLGKSTVEINTILERVIVLLDRKDFTLTDRVHVSTRYEATMPPLVDEEINLKFREQRYRLLVL